MAAEATGKYKQAWPCTSVTCGEEEEEEENKEEEEVTINMK